MYSDEGGQLVVVMMMMVLCVTFHVDSPATGVSATLSKRFMIVLFTVLVPLAPQAVVVVTRTVLTNR